MSGNIAAGLADAVGAEENVDGQMAHEFVIVCLEPLRELHDAVECEDPPQ